jgi:hypothetical protein
MTLINTDGLSFIGPGSEWFWTAAAAGRGELGQRALIAMEFVDHEEV